MSSLDLDAALSTALHTVDRNLVTFADVYPDDATEHGIYPVRRARKGYPPGSHTGWTTGFWPGMLWLAYELTGADKYRAAGEVQVERFADRLARKIDVDHHDIGFLYSLSCVAAYRLTGNQLAHQTALRAADQLMTRFLDVPGILQAWGALDDPEQRGRTIVDSLMNVPLLYWAADQTWPGHPGGAAASDQTWPGHPPDAAASDQTWPGHPGSAADQHGQHGGRRAVRRVPGDPRRAFRAVPGDIRFVTAGTRHTEQLLRHMVRPDGSTYHTFYFDLDSGAPRFGRTHQGHADESTWSRGQAWALYGFALCYRYTRDERFLEAAQRVADVFLAHTPADGVAYWDFTFADGSREPKDSSASAIAACGLLELGSDKYCQAASRIVAALHQTCAPPPTSPSNTLLLHGTQNRKTNQAVDEGNLWGDYFYLESLTRLARPNWTPYW